MIKKDRSIFTDVGAGDVDPLLEVATQHLDCGHDEAAKVCIDLASRIIVSGALEVNDDKE